MITKAHRNTQVTSDTLEHREPGDMLTHREPAPTAVPDAAVELAALKARIEAARQVKPQPHEWHCLDCFQKGRNAAIRAIVGHE